MVPASVRTCFPIPQFDGLTTCDGLLAHFTLRLYIWLIGWIAFFGNIAVFIVHVKNRKSKNNQVPTFLIANLAIADFSVAVYLLIIAISDRIYGYSNFATESELWLRSVPCSLASFICCTASLMSVFMMLIISIDRYICIVYPFSERKLKLKSAFILVVSFWLFAAIFVGIPVIYSIGKDGENRLHGYSSICMASNVVNENYKWWITAYTCITIVCWMITCILYARMLNYIRKTSNKVKKSEPRKDFRITLRLLLILITDLISWIPYYIIFMQVLLTSEKVDILTLQFVIIIALPINSAVNPCLYTISSQTVIKKANKINTSIRSAYRKLYNGSSYRRTSSHRSSISSRNTSKREHSTSFDSNTSKRHSIGRSNKIGIINNPVA